MIELLFALSFLLCFFFFYEKMVAKLTSKKKKKKTKKYRDKIPIHNSQVDVKPYMSWKIIKGKYKLIYSEF